MCVCISNNHSMIHHHSLLTITINHYGSYFIFITIHHSLLAPWGQCPGPSQRHAALLGRAQWTSGRRCLAVFKWTADGGKRWKWWKSRGKSWKMMEMDKWWLWNRDLLVKSEGEIMFVFWDFMEMEFQQHQWQQNWDLSRQNGNTMWFDGI